jgi:hypothetical protein
MKIMFFGSAGSYAEQRQLDQLKEEASSQFRGVQVEDYDGESRESVGKLESYDILNTPAVIVAQDDGTPLGIWQHRLPTLDEITYLVHGRV